LITLGAVQWCCCWRLSDNNLCASILCEIPLASHIGGSTVLIRCERCAAALAQTLSSEDASSCIAGVECAGCASATSNETALRGGVYSQALCGHALRATAALANGFIRIPTARNGSELARVLCRGSGAVSDAGDGCNSAGV